MKAVLANLPEKVGAGPPVPSSARWEADGTKAGASRPDGHAPISARWLWWFTHYSRWYVRRHFHSLKCCREGLPELAPRAPWVVYVNHASWWDPLVGLILKEALFPHRSLYAPMEQKAVDRYAMLQRMGFFGVERGSARGAIRFLRAADRILACPDAVLSMTPQGRFADPRERPLRFEPGLGALAARSPGAVFLPVAIEYVFWEERLPEILVRFGSPLWILSGHDESGLARSAAEWTHFFEDQMGGTQDALAEAAHRRQPGEFRILLRGGAGQGGVYDLWRGIKARVKGETFQREHGVK